MQAIKINDQTVHVDIIGELEAYEWTNARWTGDKLIANSPFRAEQRPSFFVNLTGELAGVWGDSGSFDNYQESGNFAKLIALLNGWSYGVAAEYLLDKYAYPDIEKLSLKPALQIKKPKQVAQLTGFTNLPTSRYLESRGITADVQALYGVGGDSDKAIMPWRTKDGLPANIKYRRNNSKQFWYERGATSLTELLFGHDVMLREKPTTVALCEAEIDAMSSYLLEANTVGIAVGNAHLSDQQIELIRQLPVERLLLAGDNDMAGAKFNEQAKRSFGGQFALSYFNHEGCKDANELLMKKS